MKIWLKRTPVLVIGGLLFAIISGCAPSVMGGGEEKVQVVATTPIIADLAKNVAGERAKVNSLVPLSGDPHTYELSLRDVRDIVYADVAFSNYMLLEEQNIIKALDANLPDGVENIALAEASVKYAAEIIPLVENVNLDTIWLGLRVIGTGIEHGASRSSTVELKATNASGPGQVSGYLTETFGNPRIYFNSADGFNSGNGYREDTATLPVSAHTHMSWGFSKAGIYEIDFQSKLILSEDKKPISMGSGTLHFAVGVDPHKIAEKQGRMVLDSGHADLSVDLETGQIVVAVDDEHGGGKLHQYGLDEVLISVPNKAITQVPVGGDFRFLGKAGSDIYQLPQAVLGKHVHGEIDPHLWQNVRNAQSYVQVIRDELIKVDPAGASEYRKNAEEYLTELVALDEYLVDKTNSIPKSNRYLVTTHDAFGYLAKAYDLEVAGFMAPNPAVEPSVSQRRKLQETISNLGVKAVFLEPNLLVQSNELSLIAEDYGIRVCPILSDSFTKGVNSYVELMEFNADSLAECLA